MNLGRVAHDARIALPHPCNHAADEHTKEVALAIPNPFAIGVTLGGLLLDVVAPRPKPRAGAVVPDLSPLGLPGRPEDNAVRREIR
jgi:hypothetical protein